jgi:hypothetical protein
VANSKYYNRNTWKWQGAEKQNFKFQTNKQVSGAGYQVSGKGEIKVAPVYCIFSGLLEQTLLSFCRLLFRISNGLSLNVSKRGEFVVLSGGFAHDMFDTYATHDQRVRQ